MLSPIIRVENLGKSYRIDHQRALDRGGRRYRRLSEELLTLSKQTLSRLSPLACRRSSTFSHSASSTEDFWAIKDVSFEVRPGEIVGIIGRNGAGKSTLLKLLSRITEPTKGKIELNGRVASLLEVGTGFHPELSGRENIFLNGAILGMSRTEIKRRFDEIVAFAEVERFLDTPVKHYSSGMYVRLAFGVAAHLDPEILVIDEVLAVGDAAFQKKCLGKMNDVAKHGRTVLFVSHQMPMIESLCESGIVLESGRVKLIASARESVQQYLNDVSRHFTEIDLSSLQRKGSGEARLNAFWTENELGARATSIASGSRATLAFMFSAHASSSSRMTLGFSIHASNEQILTVVYSDYQGVVFDTLPEVGVVRCTIPKLPLSEGTYYVAARVEVNGGESDWPQGFVGRFDVEGGDFYGCGLPFRSGIGPVLIDGEWSLKPNNDASECDVGTQ